MNTIDTRIFLTLMVATFSCVFFRELLGTLGFGLMSLAWATAMQKQ